MANKGDRRERELVNMFYDSGWAPMRAPASGAATDRELPDVLVGDGSVSYAIEAKSSSGAPIYIDGGEIDGLLFFSTMFGARQRVGVRFDNEKWMFLHPSDLYVTDAGNYRVKKEKALSEGVSFSELVGD